MNESESAHETPPTVELVANRWLAALAWWLFDFCGWPMRPLREMAAAVWAAAWECGVAISKLTMLLFWPIILGAVLCNKTLRDKTIEARARRDKPKTTIGGKWSASKPAKTGKQNVADQPRPGEYSI